MTAETKAKASNPENNAAETLETVTAVGKETIEAVINMSTEAAHEGYKNASAYGKEQMEAAEQMTITSSLARLLPSKVRGRSATGSSREDGSGSTGDRGRV